MESRSGGPPGALEGFPRYRWAILALIVTAHTVVIIAGLALVPLAPFVLGDLVSSRTELGILISALLVGGGIGSTPGGWLADRSTRWTLVGGQALLGIMVLTVSRVSSFEASLGFLLLGGLGLGAVVAAVPKAISSWFPARERALALGMTMAAAPLGNALISTTLPFLGQSCGWRQALVPVAALTFASGVASGVLFRVSPVEAGRKKDGRVRDSGVWDTLKRKSMWLLILSAILMGAAEQAWRTYFLLHLTEVVLLSAVVGGWYLALAHGSGLVGRLGWGMAADRWFQGDREGLFAMLTLLSSLAFVLLALGWGSPWILPVVAVLLGLAGSGWVGVWTLILLDRVRPQSAGKEIGLALTFTYVGIVAGPILFGRGVDMTGSYQAMWLVLAAITVPAAVAGFLLRRLRGASA